MRDYMVVIEAPSLHRRDAIGPARPVGRPVTLCRARHALWAFAVRLEGTNGVTDLTADWWVADDGEIREGISWHMLHGDGQDRVLFRAYVDMEPDEDVDAGEQ